MNFKSYSDLSYDIKKHVIPKIPVDVGVVYGIPRSGMLPASIISTFLGVPLAPVGGKPMIGARGSTFRSKGTKILLVDDSIYGGAAMSNAHYQLNYDKNVVKLAVYAHSKSVAKVDIFGIVLDGPRFFEWNFLGIKATEKFMFDMDGVICTDPRVFDDDGPNYGNEIHSGVRPLYLPQVKIHSICTNRIERWRSVTEDWLNRHGVEYGKLIMQQYDTAVARRKYSFTPEYKAEHFNNSDAEVFVESHEAQAVEIAKRTSKPVLSIESMKLYNA